MRADGQSVWLRLLDQKKREQDEGKKVVKRQRQADKNTRRAWKGQMDEETKRFTDGYCQH